MIKRFTCYFNKFSFLSLPLIIGAGLPWIIWLTLGVISANVLYVLTFGTALFYLIILHIFAKQALKQRKILGRKYQNPTDRFALIVSMGLAFSFLTPGISANALIAQIGMPRLQGDVDQYRVQDLFESGAALELDHDIFNRHIQINLIPGGKGSFQVYRFDQPVIFSSNYWIDDKNICFQLSNCLSIDPKSGILQIKGITPIQMGRIKSVKNNDINYFNKTKVLKTTQSGMPWEIQNVFKQASEFFNR